jgi:hypothetical protein
MSLTMKSKSLRPGSKRPSAAGLYAEDLIL